MRARWNQAQRVALSNLGLAEGYRRAVAAQFQKKPSNATDAAATTTTSFATGGQAMHPSRPEISVPSCPTSGSNANDTKINKNKGNTQQTHSRNKAENSRGINDSRSPSVAACAGAEARGGRASFWKRRGRALAPRRKQDGRAVSATHGTDQIQKEFFCADALSVCIASVVDS